MKTTTLFRLGGLVILLSAMIVAFLDLLYFVAKAQSASTWAAWLGILIDVFRVFGLGALFARQAQRGGILGLIGYVLLVCGSLAGIAFGAVQFGVLAGVVSNDQLAQVHAYAIGTTILFWSLYIGEVAFGISIIRAQVLSKYAGALLVLVGVLHYLTGPLAFTRPIYSIVSVVAYAWLGWILASQKDKVTELM